MHTHEANKAVDKKRETAGASAGVNSSNASVWLEDNRPRSIIQKKQVQALSAKTPAGGMNTASVVQMVSAGDVVQRLPHSLTEDDIGKVYNIRLANKVVAGEFKSFGRTGMHNFIGFGGEEDGEEIRVHYANIIGLVDGSDSLATDEEDDGMQEEHWQDMEEGQEYNANNENDGNDDMEEEEVDQEKIDGFLSGYKQDQKLELKTRTSAQRFDLKTDGSQILKQQLQDRGKGKKGGKKKTRKQFIDPSYHETVNYMNIEYGKFYDNAQQTLDPNETRIAYDQMLSGKEASKDGLFFKSVGPSPLTTMTPLLMSTYQDMHYKTELQKGDETSTTRSYEAEYTNQVTKKLPFSHWRPFVLPAETNKEETSMINAIGGTMDVQVPTDGKTIGQGKIFSAIFKHFQKSMEMLNQQLDKDFGEYSGEQENAFEERTKLHMETLDSNIMYGLYENEEANFKPEDGFATWQDLRQVIDTLSILIAASLDNVPEDQDEDFEILINLTELENNSPRNSAFVKQFELIGTILGLMIKKEKRQVLNYQMFGNVEQLHEALNNLYELSRVEAKLNKQIPDLKTDLGSSVRKDQERKAFDKELRNLK